MSEDSLNEVPIAARRTESLDAPRILKLVRNETNELFGRVNIVQLIEKSNIAISLVDENNALLGHAAFLDYPNGQIMDQSKWETLFKNVYKAQQCTPLNTLFLHYFVSKPDFSHGSLNEIMRTLFNAVPALHFVILMVPIEASPGAGILKVFEPLERKDGIAASDQTHQAYVCQRHNHCPVLYIRSARVEDHDDLMPIFDKHNDDLTSIYGDFFLSELIEAEDDNNKSIVADVAGTAFGFMSLCSDVDIDVLDECFELEPFNDLKSIPKKKPVKKDPVSTAKQEVKTETPKSRPATEISIAIKTEESSTPSSMTSPTEKSAPSDTPAPAMSSLTPTANSKSKSPISKGSFHKKKQKSAKGKASAKKPERQAAPAKSPAPMDENIHEEKRPESEMTIKMDKEEETVENAPGQEEEEDNESEDDNEKEVDDEPEPDPVPSAVCIKLFCIDEKYEMRSMDFLAQVFTLFPEKEFCVITIPHTVPELPLLQSFKRATPKAQSTLSQELYVFNRNGLLSSINVRPCATHDWFEIEKLIKNTDGKEFLLADVRRFLDSRRDEDGTEIKCYVAECIDQVIGVSVLRQEEDIEYIRAHYNIEDFVYFNHHERQEHGHLHHFAINPSFSHYTKHFLKEMLRLSKKSCIYYPLYKSIPDAQVVKPHSLVTCINDLVPIRVRRQIVYPVEDLEHNAPSERILKKQDGYSLYHMNRKLTLEPKVVINVRIVVVGASDVGVSCLDTFVNCPHLCFNDLTLISDNGLEEHKPGRMSSALATSLCFNEKEYEAMALSTFVNVVNGKMTKIDRIDKQVIISNGRKVPYDHLLLCTGQQFQYPVPTGADITKLVTTSEATKQGLLSVYKGFLPDNIFLVNYESDVESALKWIQENLLHSSRKALIYGSTIQAYGFIEGLLKLGLPGENIVFVQPPFTPPSCFNDPRVESIVHSALKEQGVTIHEDCTLARWNDGEKDATIRCATFTSSTKPVRVECQAFFCFQEKRVDYDAFKAINDSCLVYDGKLVIDSNFRTNDPFIKSAGSLTKYARRYHAEAWNHITFSSREIGIKLAESMLNMFDPTLEGALDASPLEEKLTPVFRRPKIKAAILPGGYKYLHVGKATVPIPLDALMSQPDYGHALMTESDDGDNYFRLHLNQYKSIETITCLSKGKIDVDNIICLYGIHERYLNNLVQRYDEGLIKDFYSFFRGSWSLAIFHDRFNDFRAEIHEILSEKEPDQELSLEAKVRKIIDEDVVLLKEQRDLLQDIYVTSRSKGLIQQRLLSYLSYNNYHLPMYAKPGMV